MSAERLAREFHEAYERLAPEYGWDTQAASRKHWQDVPQENRNLMVATIAELLARGVIYEGDLPALPGW